MTLHPRRVLFASLAAVVALFAVACGGGDADPTPTPFGDDPTPISNITPVGEFPLEVPRSDGKTLTLAGPPGRIVSLSPAATEILYAIGAQQSLAAVDEQANYPPEAAAFATKVDAFEPNIEAIAALTPDLVIVASDSSGIVSKLDAINIPVYFQDIDTDITTVEDVLAQIALLGRVTGRSADAAEVLGALGERLQAVKDGVQGVNSTTSPKVYHELDSTFFTASEQSFIGDLYRTLRARNIAGDGGGSPFPQLTQEAIIAAAPEVIILADEEFGVTIESVKARPGWDAIPAVQNDQIYGISADIVSRPGPRIIDALEQLAKAVHPTRFQ